MELQSEATMIHPSPRPYYLEKIRLSKDDPLAIFILENNINIPTLEVIDGTQPVL